MAELTLAVTQTDRQLGVAGPNRPGANLLSFAELSLMDSMLHDVTLSMAGRSDPNDPATDPLLKASRALKTLAGFVEAGERGRVHSYVE